MWYLALNKNRFDQHPPWPALDNPIMIKHDPVLTIDEEQTVIRLLFSEYAL